MKRQRRSTNQARHWAQVVLLIIVYVSILLFIVKISSPGLPFISGIRRSVLLFIPFTLLVIRNAFLKQGPDRIRWSVIGFIGLLYILAWRWSIETFAKINIGQPPLMIYSAILLPVIALTPFWRKKIFTMFNRIKLISEEDFYITNRDKAKSYRFGYYGLAIVILVFTLIKLPYFSTTFTGEHNLKYAWSVEIADNMAEHNSPVWIQTKYTIDPTNNHDGKIDKLEILPMMEWGLFAIYELLPANDIETNTRIFTHLIGIILLSLAYIFFRNYFPLRLTLIVVLLLAINPIFSFATFVTVYDSLVMLGTFGSMILLHRFISKDMLRDLFWAAIVFGICITIKYSVFLWLAPIGLLLLYQKRQTRSVYICNSMLFISLSLAPSLVFKYSLAHLPSRPGVSLIMLFLWSAFFFIAYKLYQQKESRIINYIDRLILSKKVWIIGVPLILLGIVGLIFLLGFDKFSNNFLTDGRLIVNWRMYYYMLVEQFRVYMTPEIFTTAGLGAVSIFVFTRYRLFKIIGILGTGALVYWITASKVIFFHNYYTLIIMVVFCLLAASAIYLMSCISRRPSVYLPIIGVGLLLLVSSSVKSNTERLRQNNPNFATAAKYLEEHTDPNSLYLDDESAASYFVVRTGRGRAWRSFLENSEVKESIKREGFGTTMEKYHISYLISQREEPNYSLYVNAFSDEKLESNTVLDRGFLIQSIVDGKSQQFSDIGKRQQIIVEKNIKQKFVLEKIIGSYKFYRFRD